ncbi:MAG: hypothetical protein K9N48_07120, partial [Verrucomicrobia bacterium]|nr:hypothetical protein [Verrucomicrobiota bacterium]
MKRDESRTISSCGYVYFLILVVGVLFILAAGADVSVMGETPAKTPDIGDSVAAETAQAVGDEPPAENSGDKEASNVGEEPQPADQAEEDSEEAADQAWEEILRLSVPPDYPEDWNDNPPTYKELEEYNRRQAELAALAARKAREFYNKYPKDNHANNARRREFELLTIAEQLGNTNVLERLLQMENKRLESGQLSEDARFELLARRVQRKAMKKVKDGMSSVAAELEKGVRSLQSDFGNRPEIYEFLMIVADNSAPDKAGRLANEILS